MQHITVTAWLLIVLVVATLAGIVAYLLPVRQLNDGSPRQADPHSAARRYEAGPPEDPHEGRHRSSDDEDTRRLGDSRLRHPEA